MTAQESPALTPDQIRQLLRECVTVVKPGEVLVIQVPCGTNADQVWRYGEKVHKAVRAMGADIHTLVLPAESLGVIEAPEPGDG